MRGRLNAKARRGGRFAKGVSFFIPQRHRGTQRGVQKKRKEGFTKKREMKKIVWMLAIVLTGCWNSNEQRERQMYLADSIVCVRKRDSVLMMESMRESAEKESVRRMRDSLRARDLFDGGKKLGDGYSFDAVDKAVYLDSLSVDNAVIHKFPGLIVKGREKRWFNGKMDVELTKLCDGSVYLETKHDIALQDYYCEKSDGKGYFARGMCVSGVPVGVWEEREGGETYRVSYAFGKEAFTIEGRDGKTEERIEPVLEKSFPIMKVGRAESDSIVGIVSEHIEIDKGGELTKERLLRNVGLKDIDGIDETDSVAYRRNGRVLMTSSRWRWGNFDSGLSMWCYNDRGALRYAREYNESEAWNETKEIWYAEGKKEFEYAISKGYNFDENSWSVLRITATKHNGNGRCEWIVSDDGEYEMRRYEGVLVKEEKKGKNEDVFGTKELDLEKVLEVVRRESE